MGKGWSWPLPSLLILLSISGTLWGWSSGKEHTGYQERSSLTHSQVETVVSHACFAHCQNCAFYSRFFIEGPASGTKGHPIFSQHPVECCFSHSCSWRFLSAWHSFWNMCACQPSRWTSRLCLLIFIPTTENENLACVANRTSQEWHTRLPGLDHCSFGFLNFSRGGKAATTLSGYSSGPTEMTSQRGTGPKTASALWPYEDAPWSGSNPNQCFV